MNTRFLTRALPVLALLAAQGACAMATSPVTGRQRAYAYTWEQEVALGREADREIVDEMGLYDDPALTEYVRRVGEDVLSRSHLRREAALPEYRNTQFTFRVLDSPEVNAFALPGGYVYVTRGLLAHLDNEAQLAMVLGHEVGHVAARHSSQQALKQGIGMVGLLGASLISEELWGAGKEVMTVGSLGVGLLSLRFSRDDERESDRLGVEYAAMAGYRAAEGSEFFAVLKKMGEKEGRMPAFLSTHPDPGRRETDVAALGAEWQAKGYPSATINRDPFWARLDGLMLGSNPRLGFVEDGTFYHPEGGFRFPVPRAWGYDQSGHEATFADAEGEAGFLFRPDAEHGTAQEAVAAFLQENGELTGWRQWTSTLAGRPATLIEASEAGEEGEEATRIRVAFVEFDGQVLRFTGLAPSSRFPEVEQALDRTLRGFGEVRERRILNVQPARLRVLTTPRQGTFRSFLPASLPPGLTVDDLALMNRVEPDQVIPRGTRLKLPG